MSLQLVLIGCVPAHHGEGGGQAGEEVDAHGQGPQSAEDVQAEGHCQHRLLGRTTNHVHAGIRMRLLNCSQIFFLLLLKTSLFRGFFSNRALHLATRT